MLRYHMRCRKFIDTNNPNMAMILELETDNTFDVFTKFLQIAKSEDVHSIESIVKADDGGNFLNKGSLEPYKVLYRSQDGSNIFLFKFIESNNELELLNSFLKNDVFFLENILFLNEGERDYEFHYKACLDQNNQNVDVFQSFKANSDDEAIQYFLESNRYFFIHRIVSVKGFDSLECPDMGSIYNFRFNYSTYMNEAQPHVYTNKIVYGVDKLQALNGFLQFIKTSGVILHRFRYTEVLGPYNKIMCGIKA